MDNIQFDLYTFDTYTQRPTNRLFGIERWDEKGKVDLVLIPLYKEGAVNGVVDCWIDSMEKNVCIGAKQYPLIAYHKSAYGLEITVSPSEGAMLVKDLFLSHHWDCIEGSPSEILEWFELNKEII